MEQKPKSQLSHDVHLIPASGVIIALVLVSAIGNVIGTMILWDASDPPRTEFLVCMGIGMMMAQVCGLAVWCALGTQKVVVRVPLTMGILFCLICIYIGTVFVMDNGMPLEVPIIFFVGTFALALLVQIPLWIFRLGTGISISRSDSRQESIEASQFGIQHLLITTTIAAMVAAAAKYLFSNGEFETNVPLHEIIPFVVTFELYISIITLLCVAFVFSGAGRILIGLLLGVVVLFGPFGVCAIVESIVAGFGPSLLANTYGFTISLVTTLTVLMFVFDSLGFRLRHSNSVWLDKS